MKKIFFFILVLISLVVLVSGCTDNGNSKLSNGTYEDQYVKFDYPTNLTVVATNGSYEFFNSTDTNNTDNRVGSCGFLWYSLPYLKKLFPDGASDKVGNHTVFVIETYTGVTFFTILKSDGSYGPCFTVDEVVKGDNEDYSYLYPQISKSLKIKKVPS